MFRNTRWTNPTKQGDPPVIQTAGRCADPNLLKVGADRKSVLLSRRFKRVGCSRGAEGEQQAISTFRYWRRKTDSKLSG
jgi:hypothetical protein